MEGVKMEGFNMIEEVGLLEAWRLWFSGNLMSDSLLWGVMKILWWGRIGKVIVLAAALTIVVDIIGPERLRSFGESLHTKKFAMTAALDFLRESRRWYKESFRKDWEDNTFPFLVAYHGSTEEDHRTAIHEFKADKLNYFVCLVLTVIVLYLYLTMNKWNSGEWWWVLAGAISMYCFLLITVSRVVTLIIVATPTIIGQSIDYALVKPLAWMLDRPHIDKLVKIAGVLLLLIGFHFDLLAS
jgi:hypothetical protein